MKVAINGLTNDYMQYLRDTWKEQFKDLNVQNISFQKLDNTKAQEVATKWAETPVSQATKDALNFLNDLEYRRVPYAITHTIGKKLTNELGDRSTIDTPFGEMKVAVKISDDVSVYLDSLAELASFDTNNDGLLTSNDLSAKNLVLIGYDKDGAEVEMSLLDVLGGVELTQFFNNPKSGIHNNSFAAVLRPEESHEQLKKENILDFFKAYADKSGWIDFTNPDIAKRIFSENELDLSYRQKNADGTTRLKRIYFDEDIESLRKIQKENKKVFGWEYHAAKSLRNAGKDYVFNSKDTGALERLRNGSMSYEHDSNLRRMNGYHPSKEYEFATGILNATITRIEEINMHNGSVEANSLARTFYDYTGMNYSESNLATVKEGLASGDMEFLETLNEHGNMRFTVQDYVIGMQLNDVAGNITMLFSSGKEVKIAIEDLYSGNGELNVDADGNRASLMNEAREMSQEDLNNLDFAQVGIKDESGTIVSLKDLGITAIQKATYPDGRFLSFILTNAEGTKINAQDLYNIAFLTSGGLESSHKEDKEESNNALANNTNKDSDSLSNKIRKMSNPLVFPNKPQVDVRI